jgi:hypothetical protein
MRPAEFDPAKLEERRAAMMRIVGLWKDRTDLPETDTYIRNLRKDRPIEKLNIVKATENT